MKETHYGDMEQERRHRINKKRKGDKNGIIFSKLEKMQFSIKKIMNENIRKDNNKSDL